MRPPLRAWLGAAGLALAALLIACAVAPETDREQLYAAEIALATVADELAVMRQAGAFDEQTSAEIDAAALAAGDALEAAHEALLAGGRIDPWLASARAGIRRLLIIKGAAEP